MLEVSYYMSIIKESKFRDDIIDVTSRFFYSRKLVEYQIICALHNTEVLGFTIFENKNRLCILHYTYILPIYRHQQVATNLLKKLFNVNKPVCQYVLNILLYDDNHNGIENFWYKLGFNEVAIDCSGYFVEKKDWVMRVEPRLKLFSTKNNYYMLDYQEIRDEKNSKIVEFVNSNSIPDFFSPLLSMDCEKKCKCYFDKNEQLVGWTIIELKNISTIEFCCTYIVKKYRNFGTLCNLWKMISKDINEKFPNVSYLIFYYDVNSVKLKKLYCFFLRDCLCKHFKRTLLKYEISIL